MDHVNGKYSCLLLVLTALAVGATTILNAATASMSSLALPATALPTTTGTDYRFEQDSNATLRVICFLGTECPLAQLYGPRLVKMANDFQNRGVAFLGVNSNLQDSMDEITAYTARYQFPFPMVKDYDQTVANIFEATRTPEVVVVDPLGVIQYRGRIDDQYQPGISRSTATRHELRDAITALLDGRPVEMSHTQPVGCLIGRSRPLAEKGEITYCEQIVRVLQTHCVECHQSGEIGPFELTDYDEVVGWADMMMEVMDQGRMPPWHANPEVGHFKNARSMPQVAKENFTRWVESGMPYGDAAKLPTPAEIAAQESRFLLAHGLEESPDALFVMRDHSYRIPAEGTVEYQYYVVDTGFTEDKWVRAAEVIPGNRSVVHHAIVFIRPPDGANIRGVSWLTAYVPGQRPTIFPEGLARRIPAGSKLVFQMHYTPNGTEAEDTTKVAMLFEEPDQVTHEVFTVVAIDQEFEIPPEASNHQVSMSLKHLPAESQLLGVAPHMHLRGKSFRLAGKRDKKSIDLLDVPQYDFNWQHFYSFAEPLKLDDWDALNCVVAFDNSSDNPTNPDPSQHVTWGDQTWEEMSIAFFELAQPLDRTEKMARTTQQVSSSNNQQAQKVRVQAFVDQFFSRFDKDHDGQVVRDETSLAFRRFGFRQFDQNQDGILDRDEIANAASVRL
ncbi:MAG: redoxin domain-containing protein [Pirellulales bacterium]